MSSLRSSALSAIQLNAESAEERRELNADEGNS